MTRIYLLMPGEFRKIQDGGGESTATPSIGRSTEAHAANCQTGLTYLCAVLHLCAVRVCVGERRLELNG